MDLCPRLADARIAIVSAFAPRKHAGALWIGRRVAAQLGVLSRSESRHWDQLLYITSHSVFARFNTNDAEPKLAEATFNGRAVAEVKADTGEPAFAERL